LKLDWDWSSSTIGDRDLCLDILPLFELIYPFELVFVNSDLGTVGGSPEIDEIIWIGPVIVGLGDIRSVFG